MNVVGVRGVIVLISSAQAILISSAQATCMDGNGFELFGIELDILALPYLIALDDVLLWHLIAGPRIDLAIPDAVTGLFVELVEADLFPFGRGWE
jgi:hypothetical protein